jgi:shikimate kinase
MSTGVAAKPSKKRKQQNTQEERLEEERLEHYNKLAHMATRAIHKEAEVVKSFECQKNHE